ncbi:MAG TPA: response regulator transcription factor [Dermatophilaceae bacterium]|nr:response regulator transcription factor [Dermatophilaceae bacterium]
MQGPARLLVVEDDPQLADLLAGLLAEEGYAVDVARDGQRGLHLGLTRDYEALVLDRGLPAVEGLDLLARLRSQGRLAPALVLSALDGSRDKVAGLDAGADDYLGKPFDVEELLARLRALLRRHADVAPVLGLPVGALEPATRDVRRPDGSVIALSERECVLLETLARNPRRVFARRDLLAMVFEDAEDEGVVDTYVHYLRRKLGREVVETVRGLGYRLGAG